MTMCNRTNSIFFIAALLLMIQGLPARGQPGKSREMNGFMINDPLIPIQEIQYGGPPRDGIPSIDNPQFIEPAEAEFLNKDDRVLGISINGVAKAYPIRIMDWHEIVNDKFKDDEVVVTYCPLCGSGIAFYSRVDGKSLDFGVSGLLYNSDVLMYDRQTKSLWSQIMFKAVSGPSKGKKLEPIITENTNWKDWKNRHPNTLVLFTNTGHHRDYNYSAYSQYKNSEALYFPVNNESSKYSRKELVLGVEVKGKYKAYPYVELRKSKSNVIEDNVNGKTIQIKYDKESGSARVINPDAKSIKASVMYWFAWFTFHPETKVYTFR